MNGFPLKFYEADGPFYDGEVEMVVVPTADGEYEVCAHHENVVVAIATGTMKYRPKDGETLYAAVSSGVLRMEKNECTILVDSAEHPEEIDEARALAQKEEAIERMLQKKSLQEYYLAEAELKRAMTRPKLKGNMIH